jgi:hypothetical protein
MKLLQTKKPTEISVSEIVDLADINRSTFYLHFGDVNHLQADIEDELFEDIARLIRNQKLGEVKDRLYELLYTIYNYFDQNADICDVLLSKTGSYAIGSRIIVLIQERLDKSYRIIPQNLGQLENYYSSIYVTNGFSGILQGWISDGRQVSTEDIARITADLIERTTKRSNPANNKYTHFVDSVLQTTDYIVNAVLDTTAGFIKDASEDVSLIIEKKLNSVADHLTDIRKNKDSDDESS